MPFHRPPPERNDKTPVEFYSITQAKAYHSQANADTQKDLVLHALSLLPQVQNNTGDNNLFILDIGCGSGLSSQHLPMHSFGVDISMSMLQLATSNQESQNNYICAQVAFGLPFRSNMFDAVISISMLQWLSNDQLNMFFHELTRILSSDGCAILQTYSHDNEHAKAMIVAANASGKQAYLIVDYPHKTSALKWFLCVGGTMQIDSIISERCPLARRFQSTCGYTYRKQHGLHPGRLVFEHVKYVGHAYRKVKRVMSLESNLESTANKKRHDKERSLFPNEQLLVVTLLELFQCDKITLDMLKERSEDVIKVMHETFNNIK
jgi:SAM-dependent methyltransferase